jgi:CRISPR-associated protein Csm2
MDTPIRPNFNFDSEMNTKGKNWITQQIDDDCINYLENFGFYLCDKSDEKAFAVGSNAMTTSQLRNIFGEIKRIQAQLDASVEEKNEDWRNAFTMLRPKLAYSTARVLSQKRDNRIKAFRTVVEKAHGHVGGDVENFRRFSQFVEGIIAYHKVYGGKD